jgi:hypothetical protein
MLTASFFPRSDAQHLLLRLAFFDTLCTGAAAVLARLDTS